MHLTVFPDCLKGDHTKCVGSYPCPPGQIGGSRCTCVCHLPKAEAVEFPRLPSMEIQGLKAQLAAEKEARVKAEKKNQIQVTCSACQNCTLGFQPQHMRDGLCIDCIRTAKETAEARVKELEAESQRLREVLSNHGVRQPKVL